MRLVLVLNMLSSLNKDIIIIIIKHRKPCTWTDCDEAGDYVVPNVLSPKDLVPRPDNMDETVQRT